MIKNNRSISFQSKVASDIFAYILSIVFSRFNNFSTSFIFLFVLFFETKNTVNINHELLINPFIYYGISWFIILYIGVFSCIGNRIGKYKSYDIDLNFYDDVITITSEYEKSIFPAESVKTLTNLPGYYVMYMASYPKLVIPKSSFYSNELLKEFLLNFKGKIH
jgi:hypothetical protein